MLFNSYIFLLFFLPICIAGYFTLNHFRKREMAQIFLLVMSLWFYGYFNMKYLILILSSIGINYFFYKILNCEKNKKRWILLMALLFNIGVLFYFKYYNFFLENINLIIDQQITWKEILLPLGISFFTFQQISFVIDAFRGEIPKCSLLNYACFVTFFPQLIAGPIVMHDELIPQFMDERRKQFQWDNFAKGIYIFALGLAKKVLLADTFGNAANWGFSNIAILNSTNAILTMLSYTIQIYFDFSGYCDMAVGIGKILNIDLPLNFNSPYKALTITEFWSRWHMTLTRFFTKYIYIPLGGNRGGTLRTYCNVMLVFCVSGLWHGAGWTFVLWGICHGVFSVLSRHYEAVVHKLHPVLNWMITFTFLNITWAIFRAGNIREGVRIINRVLLFDFGIIDKNITSSFNLPEFLFINKRFPILNIYPQFFMISFFVFAIWLLLGSKNAYEKMQEFLPTTGKLISTVILLIWCIFSFSGVSTFLYFNF